MVDKMSSVDNDASFAMSNQLMLQLQLTGNVVHVVVGWQYGLLLILRDEFHLKTKLDIRSYLKVNVSEWGREMPRVKFNLWIYL